MDKKQDPLHGTILIRLDGDTTTAIAIPDKDSGFYGIQQATSKRNHKDRYDAYTGVRLALDRLFGKEGAENPPFQVGDIVEVTTKPSWARGYEPGDICELTGLIISPLDDTLLGAHLRVLSRERRGNRVSVTLGGIRLVHRPGKGGGAQ